MSICWYCYWGWPQAVMDIYRRACVALNDPDGNALRYGPGHIVWEDENWGSGEPEWCLEHFAEHDDHLNDHERAVVRQSLVELAALPLAEREVIPDDYDDAHPQDYPPPDGVVMADRCVRVVSRAKQPRRDVRPAPVVSRKD